MFSIAVACSYIHKLRAILLLADSVVVIYEDKCVQKLPPESIDTHWIRPRFSSLDLYHGLKELEVGLSVRIRWNNRYPHSKATIIGVGSDADMDELFKQKSRENQQSNVQVNDETIHSPFVPFSCVESACIILVSQLINHIA